MKILNYIIFFVILSSFVSASLSWSGISKSIADLFYMNADGDTMTGDLNIGQGGYSSGGITLTTAGGAFVQDLILAGNITKIGGIEINGSLNPADGITASLGNASNSWDSIHGNLINLTTIGWLRNSEIATLADLTSGNVTLTTVIVVRNDEPVTLTKGTPVYFTSYVSGINVEGVNFANNSEPNKHADCVISETIPQNQQGQCVETGHVITADTTAFSFGDDLYLDSGGNLTHDKPIFAPCIQKVGMVLRSHASQGVIWVSGTDRCNDIPSNINITGDFFGRLVNATTLNGTLDCTMIAGGTDADFCVDGGGGGSSPWNSSGSNVFLNDSTANVGIGTTNPIRLLDVDGSATIYGTLNVSLVNATSGNFTGTVEAGAITSATIGATNIYNIDGTTAWLSLSTCGADTGVSGINADGTITCTADTSHLQDLWDVFTSDSGSTTANSNTDTLTVSGGGTVSTGISGDILTITGSAHITDEVGTLANTRVCYSDGSNVICNDAGLSYTVGSDLLALTGNLDIEGDVEMSDGNHIGIASNERIVFDATNNWLEILGAKVGIGNTAPLNLLHVSGITQTQGINISGGPGTINLTIGNGTGEGRKEGMIFHNGSGICIVAC